MTEMIRAFHFLRADLTAGSGDEPAWTEGETRTIALANGAFAVIDAEDISLLPSCRWSFAGRGYVSTHAKVNGERTRVYLHRLIMGASDNVQVDHINGDKLDCRKTNLRLVTNKQNHENTPRSTANSTTKVRGVRQSVTPNRYVAHLTHEGKYIHLGTFETVEAASIAARNGRRQYFTHSPECTTPIEPSPHKATRAVRNRVNRCKRGHLFNAQNTRIRKNGTRFCRACDRQRSANHRSEVA